MPSSIIVSLLLLLSLLAGRAFGSPDDLANLKGAFLQGSMARNDYMDRLVKLRYDYVWNGGNNGNSSIDKKISAIDEEIKKHPLAPDSNSDALSRLRTGVWESPRHGYLYRSDHTWTMLPIEMNVTHGFWKIEGNKYYDWASVYPEKPLIFTILLLDAKYLVFTDGTHIEYEKRRG